MYTKADVVRLLRTRKKWDVKYVTFYTWYLKGYIKNQYQAHYVGRSIGVYSEKDFENIVTTLEKLNKQGRVRIKLLI